MTKGKGIYRTGGIALMDYALSSAKEKRLIKKAYEMFVASGALHPAPVIMGELYLYAPLGPNGNCAFLSPGEEPPSLERLNGRGVQS
jgi:hypothetical protein